MAVYDGQHHHYDDHDEIPALDSYPAGKNLDDLLLCGPRNETEWVMSDTYVDVREER